MRAVVLAGGEGTRLRPYTAVLPKPLVPLGDRPILEHVLERLAVAGVSRADICLGYLGELIQAYFAGGRHVAEDLSVVWHREPEPLGTAGAVGLVGDLEAPFLVVNGDVVSDLDLRAMYDAHLEREADLTVAIQAREIDVGLGVVETDGELVAGFVEKPKVAVDINMGLYVFGRGALRHLPAGPCQMPELIGRLLREGSLVHAFRSDAVWHDIGTFDGLGAAAEAQAAAVQLPA